MDAHIAKNGELEKKFEGVLAAFCSHHSFITKQNDGMPASKLTTLRDRITKLVANRRAQNKRNIAASGISEEHGELEKNLDNLIAEEDEKKEAEAEAKQKFEQKEQALIDEGRSVRNSAMKRNSFQSLEASSPQKKKKVARMTMDLTGDRELELMEEEAKHRRETEKKRFELEELRIALAEESQNAQMDLMRALIAKLNYEKVVFINLEHD